MEIRCPNCQKIFAPKSEVESLVVDAINKGQRLLIIECPECYKDVPIDPTNLMSKESQKDEVLKKQTAENIQCPICDEGIVTYIENGEEKFWGCGECGNVWFTKDSLEKDILAKAR